MKTFHFKNQQKQTKRCTVIGCRDVTTVIIVTMMTNGIKMTAIRCRLKTRATFRDRIVPLPALKKGLRGLLT